MLLDIQSRSKSIKSVSTDEFADFSFTNDIVELICKQSGLNKNRIRLSVENDGKRTPMIINTQLKAYNLNDNAKITVKDLGPQISWKLVFVIEYLGPILIHSLFFYGVREFYGHQVTMTPTQIALYDLTLAHFTKREYETLFVHRFSNATMPLFNIFKNCAHYWGLNGLLCGAFTYGPPWLRESENSIVSNLFHINDWSGEWVGVFAVLILVLEYCNYLTHKNLSDIRAKDPKNYQIPYGFGFNWVSCPNYLFEILAFVGFTVFSGNWAYVIFTIVASVQMYIWAVGKHKRYLKTFGDEYKKLNRKVLIPYIL